MFLAVPKLLLARRRMNAYPLLSCLVQLWHIPASMDGVA